MATQCANCGSHNTQAQINTIGCLDCGKQTDYDGNPAAAGMDDATRTELLSRLGPRTTHVVGNLADLQRGGAAVVKGEGTMSDGVETPPGVSADTVKDEAKAQKAFDKAVAPLLPDDTPSDATAASKK